jgi:F0F1-type ATP synthase assembly protein I
MRHLGLGLTWMVSALGFALLGRWLDARFGTEPVLLLIGALFGSVAGFWYLYRQAVVVPREEAARRAEARRNADPEERR